MLATQEWLTPTGRTIWHRGIQPDELVGLPSDVAPLIPEKEREMTPAQLRASGDEQLLRALDLLSSPVQKQVFDPTAKQLPS
jgi:C-terminal processing protease CtpA/Prc